jgi:hypothetical protein
VVEWRPGRGRDALPRVRRYLSLEGAKAKGKGRLFPLLTLQRSRSSSSSSNFARRCLKRFALREASP